MRTRSTQPQNWIPYALLCVLAIAILQLGTPTETRAGGFVFSSEGFESTITHPEGYSGVGGVVAVSVCIDPASTSAAAMVGPVTNAVAEWNALTGTSPNLVFGASNNIPAGFFDFESVLLHELGHCIGLSHVNHASESGLPAPLNDGTKSTDGPNNVFNQVAGADTIHGSADDLRSDDGNLHWFVDADNDPCTATSPATVDASTMSVGLGSLPAGDLFAANGDRTVCGALGFGSTEAVMNQGTGADEAQRTIGGDEERTIRLGMSGVDETQGTGDDYTVVLSYVGMTTVCDIPIDNTPGGGFAFCSLGGVGIAPDHVAITSALIHMNSLAAWFFNPPAGPVMCEDAGGFPVCDLPCPIPGDICVNTGVDCECEPPPPVECEDPGGFPVCDLPCPIPGDICVNTGADCQCQPPPPVECEDPGGFPVCDLPCPIPGDICVNTGADCQCQPPPPVECEDPGGFPVCDLPCPIPGDICVNTGADCQCQPPPPVECEDPGGFPVCDLPCPIPGDICVNTGADCQCQPPPPVECEDPGGFPVCDLPCPIPTDICVNTGAACVCEPPPPPDFCEDPGAFPQCDLPCPIPTDICVNTGAACVCEPPPPPDFCEDPGAFPQCDLPCPIPTDICVNTGADCQCEPPPPVECEDPGAFPQCDLPCPIPGDICVNTGADCQCEPPPPVECEDPGAFPQCDLPCPIPGDICVNTGADCQCEPPPPVECEEPGAFPQCDLPCPIPTDICVNTGNACVCEPPPPVECEDPGAFPQCDLPCPIPTDICVNTGADCQCQPPPPVECEDPGTFPQCDLPCPNPTDICVNTGNACECEPQEGACCRNGAGTETDCFITTEDDCLTNHHIFFGPGSECTDDLDCVALVVTLDSVSAKATANGVLVRWTTVMEIDTIGFRVLRESVGSRTKRLQVVAEMIPAAGHGLGGASYLLLDDSRESASAVSYYLEDIDIYGRVTRHGPFAVEHGTRVIPQTREDGTDRPQR